MLSGVSFLLAPTRVQAYTRRMLVRIVGITAILLPGLAAALLLWTATHNLFAAVAGAVAGTGLLAWLAGSGPQ